MSTRIAVSHRCFYVCDVLVALDKYLWVEVWKSEREVASFTEHWIHSLCCAWLLSRVQLFVTPWVYSWPSSSVHGEWVAMPSSRGSSQPRIKPRSPVLPSEPPGKPKFILYFAFSVNSPLAILSLRHSERHLCYLRVCRHCHRGALQHLKRKEQLACALGSVMDCVLLTQQLSKTWNSHTYQEKLLADWNGKI